MSVNYSASEFQYLLDYSYTCHCFYSFHSIDAWLRLHSAKVTHSMQHLILQNPKATRVSYLLSKCVHVTTVTDFSVAQPALQVY